jgi:ABC-type antimicrobial peptide transport system permease subunit
VLLVSALLFVRSLLNLTRLEAGFQQDGILIANVSWRRLNLPPERIPPHRRDLIERLRAGLLAAIGLYGVIAYMIVQRQHEIGIRMALGAKRRDILTMMLREGGMLLGIGLLAGTILSLAAGRAASALLFGLQPSDPVAHATAAAALAVVALAASYVPARRAARLDPMIALRDE